MRQMFVNPSRPNQAAEMLRATNANNVHARQSMIRKRGRKKGRLSRCSNRRSRVVGQQCIRVDYCKIPLFLGAALAAPRRCSYGATGGGHAQAVRLERRKQGPAAAAAEHGLEGAVDDEVHDLQRVGHVLGQQLERDAVPAEHGVHGGCCVRAAVVPGDEHAGALSVTTAPEGLCTSARATR